MTVKEIDKIAKAKSEMPELSSVAELGLYVKLLRIYGLYDEKKLTVDLAKEAKAAAISEFEHLNKLSELENVFINDNKRNSTLGSLMSKVNKSGCPLCRGIAMVYDGRKTG